MIGRETLLAAEKTSAENFGRKNQPKKSAEEVGRKLPPNNSAEKIAHREASTKPEVVQTYYVLLGLC